MSKNTSQQNNQETIKTLLTGGQPPKANNNISKSSELQALFSEALVEQIAQINTIQDLKKREQELIKLSNNAASLLSQPKSYMQILVKDTARTMVDEHMMQRLKKEIPHISTPMAEEIISNINHYQQEAPTAKQRAAGIERLAEHAAKNWIQAPQFIAPLSLESFQTAYKLFAQSISEIQGTQDLAQRATKITKLQNDASKKLIALPKPENFDNFLKQYHYVSTKPKDYDKSIKQAYTQYKVDYNKYISTPQYKSTKENYNAFVKKLITEVANNNTNLPAKGILSKISNNIKLLFTQINNSIDQRNDKTKQIKQSITTARTNWAKKIAGERSAGNNQYGRNV